MEQKTKQVSEKFRRQRKMLLLLPVVVVPLLCVAFHGLGGGSGGVTHSGSAPGKGLNMSLPEARFDPKKKALNKLGFYKQADKDSVRLLEIRKLDPYYARLGVPVDSVRRLQVGGIPGRLDTGWIAGRSGAGGAGIGGLTAGAAGTDRKADELLQKLDRLKAVLSRQETSDKFGLGGVAGRTGMASLSAEGRALAVVPGIGAPGLSGGIPGMHAAGQGDPDLDKLSGMLDKILRIQHPGDGVADTVGRGSEARVVGALSAAKKEEAVRMLVDGDDIRSPGRGQDSVEVVPGSGFMNLDDESGLAPLMENVVEAVIAHDQTVVSGEAVELRMDQESVINGVHLPKGSSVWGKASLSGERLQVAVTSVRVGNDVLPVALEVFDLDGLAGVRVPGAINRDVSKQSADEAINTLGVGSFDAGLGGQAAAAGVQAAKTLLSRKVRLVRVSLKAGYRVLLKNSKTK